MAGDGAGRAATHCAPRVPAGLCDRTKQCDAPTLRELLRTFGDEGMLLTVLLLPRRLQDRAPPANQLRPDLHAGRKRGAHERISRPRHLPVFGEGRLVNMVNNLAFFIAAAKSRRGLVAFTLWGRKTPTAISRLPHASTRAIGVVQGTWCPYIRPEWQILAGLFGQA